MKIQYTLKLLRFIWTQVLKDECIRLADSTESQIDDVIVKIIDLLLTTKEEIDDGVPF